ncbi:hypothetical protein JCM19236_3133 [Vibrio sp. JCM 19236]|nr:hypothetical protein JCM19236_3133 [Vibrio sp. JCM 19236]
MKKSIALSTLLLACMSASSFADTGTTTDIQTTQNVDQITCGQFLELGEEVMPVTVGYLYAVNSQDSQVDIIQVQDLVNVEVDSIVEECITNPDILALMRSIIKYLKKAKIAKDVELAM